MALEVEADLRLEIGKDLRQAVALVGKPGKAFYGGNERAVLTAGYGCRAAHQISEVSHEAGVARKEQLSAGKQRAPKVPGRLKESQGRTSNRSSIMTLSHTFTKSFTKRACPSRLA